MRVRNVCATHVGHHGIAIHSADERKEKLKEAAEKMRDKGVTQSAFTDSRYAVSEDKTPNIHSRQEEGAKSQSNV